MNPTPVRVWTPGIDVSHYQGVIDWPAVARAGIKFAYIKASEGAVFSDPAFVANVAGARAAGLLVGAYHYLDGSGITQQMDHCQATLATAGTLLNLRPLDLPLALDVEEYDVSAGDVATWLDLCKGVLYCGPTFAVLLAQVRPALTAYPLWVAEYTVAAPKTASWPKWTFWQHTAEARVPGITTVVDLDWFNGTLEELQALGQAPSPGSAAPAGQPT